MHTTFRVILILTVISMLASGSSVLGFEGNKAKPPAPKPQPQETTVIIVNERTLVGPNSVVQLRGGRLFLLMATIAQALGYTFSSDSTQRIEAIRRQNGTGAVFNAPL